MLSAFSSGRSGSKPGVTFEVTAGSKQSLPWL